MITSTYIPVIAASKIKKDMTDLSAASYQWVHRIAALFLILLLSPIFIITWLAIRLESKGNAVFSQIRVGYCGRQFTLYKFRSMYSDMSNRPPTNISSSREGVCEKFYNDPRITRVGKVIRKLSIDELPQLFNVLLGDMALIGPRPALVKEVNQYDQRTLERLKAMPGITGLWQVSGRADTTFSQQVDLDISYVRNRSVFLDLKIAFLTIPAVLSAKGAY